MGNIKMSDVEKIFKDYYSGKVTLEDANAQLKNMGVDVRIAPGKNEYATEYEKAEIKLNGYAMLDTGTGTKNKVFVKDNVLQNVDCGNMHALLIVDDNMFEVNGNKVGKYIGKVKA